MSRQSKTGDIGQRVHASQLAQLDTGRVEFGGRGNHGRVAGGIKFFFLQRRTQNTHAEGLTENQFVTRLGISVALQIFWVDDADSNEPVNRLDGIDGVSAGNRDTGGFTDRFATVENFFDGRQRQGIDRHTD